jgi:hypothetical protein
MIDCRSLKQLFRRYNTRIIYFPKLELDKSRDFLLSMFYNRKVGSKSLQTIIVLNWSEILYLITSKQFYHNDYLLIFYYTSCVSIYIHSYSYRNTIYQNKKKKSREYNNLFIVIILLNMTVCNN